MNPLISKFSPTVTRMIRMDHAHVIGQYHKLQPDTSKDVREAVVSNVCTALEIHAQLEEEIFYPALRDTGVQLAALDRSVPEHDEVRRLIETVRGLPVDDPGHASAFAELMRCVMHHIAEEENVVLPAAEERLADRLQELGAQMTEARMKLTRPQAGSIAANLLRSSPAKAALVTAGAIAGVIAVNSLRKRRSPEWQ